MTPFLPFLGMAQGAWAWIRDSWLGRAVAVAAAMLVAYLIIERRGYRRGARETKDYIDQASNEAAERRRKGREKVDLDAARVGSADRLRARWSRD